MQKISYNIIEVDLDYSTYQRLLKLGKSIITDDQYVQLAAEKCLTDYVDEKHVDDNDLMISEIPFTVYQLKHICEVNNVDPNTVSIIFEDNLYKLKKKGIDD